MSTPSLPIPRTALVTGASRGIGAAIADAFERAGCRVLRPSRQELALDDPAAVDRYCAALTDQVDILVNNAGINPLTRIADLSHPVIASVLQVNLVSAMQLTAALAPRMADRGWGRIVSVSSIWSVRAKERRAMYAVSKAGLNAFTRTIAAEFGPGGVLANAIAPGFIDTDLTRKNLSPEEIQTLAQQVPVRALGSVQDVARTVVFLGSDANTYINGQVIVADGGFTCV